MAGDPPPHCCWCHCVGLSGRDRRSGALGLEDDGSDSAFVIWPPAKCQRKPGVVSWLNNCSFGVVSGAASHLTGNHFESTLAAGEFTSEQGCKCHNVFLPIVDSVFGFEVRRKT